MSIKIYKILINLCVFNLINSIIIIWRLNTVNERTYYNLEIKHVIINNRK